MITSVGILEMGRNPADVPLFKDSPTRFRAYFDGVDDLTLVNYPVFKTGKVPAPTDSQAWIITGSTHSVYDDIPWMSPMMAFVREAVERNIPVLGICFGHQLMGQAFGGEVRKSLKGRGLGVHTQDLTEAGKRIFTGMESLKLMAAHQDQVLVPPPQATLLAASNFCANAAFAYGKTGLSLQGHPEISVDFERFIINSWQESDPVAQEVVDTALASLDSVPTDAQNIRPVLVRFLKGELNLA